MFQLKNTFLILFWTCWYVASHLKSFKTTEKQSQYCLYFVIVLLLSRINRLCLLLSLFVFLKPSFVLDNGDKRKTASRSKATVPEESKRSRGESRSKTEATKSSARLASKSTKSSGLNLVKLKSHAKPPSIKTVSYNYFFVD